MQSGRFIGGKIIKNEIKYVSRTHAKTNIGLWLIVLLTAPKYALGK